MEKELYELVQEQQSVLFGMKFTKHKELMNIALEFQIDCEVDLHYLIQAINLATLRNPNNRIRIIKKNDKFYQYFSDDAQEKIDYLEFSNNKEYENYIKKFAQTPFKNNGIDTQLYRVNIIKKPNGKYALCGCFSHLIYDAYSSAMYYKETLEIYNALIKNEPLPKEGVSPILAYKAQEKYISSKKYEIDEKYYKQTFNTEPQYTVLSGTSAKTFLSKKKTGLQEALIDRKFKADSLLIPIDNEFRDKVFNYAREKKISAQSLYTFACRTYLSCVCNTDDVMIDVTINKRSTLIEQKAGGTLATVIYLRTILDNNSSFFNGLNIVNNTTLDIYKHSYYPPQEISKLQIERYKLKKSEKYSSLIFTYQPPTKLSDEINYSLKRLPNGREWTTCYIDIMPCNSDNEYVADYSYMPKIISKKTIIDYHNFMIAFINEGIKDDTQSISDIIKKVGK